MKRKDNGISLLIAVLILLSISIAGAFVLLSFFNSFQILIEERAFSIEDASLLKDTDGKIIFTVTVKNSGSMSIVDVRVELDGEDEAILQEVSGETPLEPGKSASLSLSSGNGLRGAYTAGQSYVFTVHARFSDGSTASASSSVKCLGSGGASTPRISPPDQPIINNVLFLEDVEDDAVVMVDLGKMEKKAEKEFDVSVTPYCAGNGKIYLVAEEKSLYEMNPETLEIERVLSLSLSEDGYAYEVCFHNDLIFVVSSDYDENWEEVMQITVVDPETFTEVRTGRPLLRGEIIGQYYVSNIAADGDYLYVIAESYNSDYDSFLEIAKIHIPDLSLVETEPLSMIDIAPDESAIFRMDIHAADGYVYALVNYMKYDQFGFFLKDEGALVFKVKTEPLDIEDVLDTEKPDGYEYSKACIINNEMYLYGFSSGSTDWYFILSSVNLDSFEMEKTKTESNPPSGGYVGIWTNGAYIFTTYTDEEGFYLRKVMPNTLSTVASVNI